MPLAFDLHKNIIELHSKPVGKYPVYFCHRKLLEKVITIPGNPPDYLNEKKIEMKRFNHYWNYAKNEVHKLTILTSALVLLVAGSSCQKSASKSPAGASPETVLAWNDIATQAFIHFPEQPAPPPMIESRIYAMVNIAMHDALNNIIPKYKTYALQSIDRSANPDAAVAQAAYDVLVAEAPWYKSSYDSLLAVSLNAVAQGDVKSKGIALGHASATAIKNKRINDGSATAQFQYVAGNLPGQYQFTAPFDGAPFNGFYVIPGWGKVKPFGLTSPAQFRPAAPYAVVSNDYTTDFNEVKNLGSVNSPLRTADQTHLALFWLENSPTGWNRIARVLIAGQNGSNMDAWKVARLFSLLQLAEADAYIGSCEAKTFYNYWRPITAIHNATTDGNPDTSPDASWEVLAFPTPPVADYPSAHATAGGAAASVISAFFGKDNMSFTTTSATNSGSRSFSSLSQAATENAESRIFVGYHFRYACIQGKNLGYNIGDYIFAHYLQPQ